jgi:tetratricopeptide (TPR) repeat protein
VRRTVLLFSGVVLAVAGMTAIQRLNDDRHYRHLLADGDRALAAHRPYVAVEAFSGALALRPDSMVAHFRRGEAYAEEGQHTQALRDLREATRLAPDAPEPLEALGRLYEDRGDHAAAAEWYAQAADRLQDSNARLLYALALARYRSGSPAAARDAARRTIARDDGMAEAHYLLGLVSRDAGQPREAMAALEHAVRLRPSFTAAREELAALYRERGRPEDEAGQLRALVDLNGHLDRHIALAMAELRAGRHEDALATLAAVDRPSDPDSRVTLALGRVYLGMAETTGDKPAIARAQLALERALGGTIRRSEGLALYGRALFLAGDLARAERLLQDAIRTSPVEPEAFDYLADVAETLDHPRVARDALLSLDALEGDTVSPSIRAARARRIGALSLAAEDPAVSVRFLTFATETGHDDGPTLGLLARALWNNGDQDAARQTLTRALALAPGDDGLRRLTRTFR